MRILEVIIPETEKQRLEDLSKHECVIESWSTPVDLGRTSIKFLANDEHSKELLEELQKLSGNYRVVIHPIEGTHPKTPEQQTPSDQKKLGKFISVSKEELYEDIDKPVELSMNFLLMVVLSSFVAGIGILKNNIAIVIGAMVIAPFLGPNMAAAFGTVLGDLRIVKRSVITGSVASIIAIVISVLWGTLAGDISHIVVDPGIETQDILLAIVCGFAGVLSVISGQGASLVGVMVAAALLPPLMRFGLLLGGGDYTNAMNSFLIFSTNIIALNLTGIVAFYMAGIRPNRWWEKKSAKRKTRNAVIIWVSALVILAIIIVLFRKLGFN